MSLRSLWTRQAEVSFRAIWSYLEREWGEMVAEAFASDVQHTIELLEIFQWEVCSKCRTKAFDPYLWRGR